MLDYTHPALNREINAIGGHYVFTKEVTMPFKGKTVLYYVGYAVINSSCCGMGGVCYARVPGFVRELKYKRDNSGAPISSIEPIHEKSIQKQIILIIQSTESIHQVEF